MKRVLFAGLIVLLSGHLSLAATIDAGNWNIYQAADQTVVVSVYGDGSETALALNFYASVVNGPGGSEALKFTELDFNDPGYMWNGSDYETPWSGSDTNADGGAGNFPSPTWQGPITIPGTQASPANLVEVTFDASSAPLGTWDFSLGEATSWSDGTTDDPTLLAGTITVIPEPSTFLLGGIAALALFAFNRGWRRRKTSGAAA